MASSTFWGHSEISPDAVRVVGRGADDVLDRAYQEAAIPTHTLNKLFAMATEAAHRAGKLYATMWKLALGDLPADRCAHGGPLCHGCRPGSPPHCHHADGWKPNA